MELDSPLRIKLLGLLMGMIRCVFAVPRRAFDTRGNQFRAKEDGKGYVLLYHFLIQIFFYTTGFSRKLLGERMHGPRIKSLTI